MVEALILGSKKMSEPRSDVLALLLSHFKSPIILTLVFAAGLSFFLRDPVDACIILVIVLISGLLGFWQERGAADAVAKLLSIVKNKAAVLRDGSQQEIPLENVVPGDIVLLNAGDAIPADCLILESRDLFVDEATMTGETYPSKRPRCHRQGRRTGHDAPWICAFFRSAEKRHCRDN